MKKLITAISVIASLLFSSPAFAYTVKSGDTMFGIARSQNLSLQELARLNPQIQNLNLIYVGQTVNTGTQDEKTTGQAVNTGTQDEKATGHAVNTGTLEGNTIGQAVHTASKAEINVGYSENELDLLARLVRAEAESEPYQGKVAVACVVLNRVASSSFPNSIKEVIYQKGQFQPVRNGEINQPADEDSIRAVQEAINEKSNVAAGSLFFYNPATATNRWLDSRATTLVIGNHVFKK
ncbi:N-acetylmuramoyl-L-alanine amidase [Bacillus sp. AFS076308]|uniref:cell wall hydrolase n=1 Tax=unclassified Bacillus (in: firmicutes) TaxID=185979 RepID=UPI000BF3E459|nr:MULTISPECIES: cell wall hydrolase [unclassified Bacillus (in: firmicutes)]PFN99238.1 N-acetylmuramoyl-L-alanine amidase [Bacillus sp. AFS076308]PGV49173.1 N-acetylmuramoyl-L-alanine amidase [Bacillus sp. AFS037270]